MNKPLSVGILRKKLNEWYTHGAFDEAERYLVQQLEKDPKRSPFELDSGIRDNGAQATGGEGHGTTHVDG